MQAGEGHSGRGTSRPVTAEVPGPPALEQSPGPQMACGLAPSCPGSRLVSDVLAASPAPAARAPTSSRGSATSAPSAASSLETLIYQAHCQSPLPFTISASLCFSVRSCNTCSLSAYKRQSLRQDWGSRVI